MTLRATVYLSRVACSEKIGAEGITADVHSLSKVQHTTRYSKYAQWDFFCGKPFVFFPPCVGSPDQSEDVC